MANVSLPSKQLFLNSKLYTVHDNKRSGKTEDCLENHCFLRFKISGINSPPRLVKAFQKTSFSVVDKENGRIDTLVMLIKEMLRSFNDGVISPSAYDTAWVARIPSIDDSKKLQFPTTLQWILKNQNEDGSWGESSYFQLYDRLICTLSCVLTLTIWSTGSDHIVKGIKFLQAHIIQLQNETDYSLLPCGFEIVFPSILTEAKSFGLDLPYDIPCLKDITALREHKISRIPIDVMHSIPTTMLYSLEALQEVVDWRRILKLQGVDGSLLGSPASTAVVYMETGDSKCLEYLTNIVNGYGNYRMFH